jgi:LPXTG-motif cell wall-anchored protein
LVRPPSSTAPDVLGVTVARAAPAPSQLPTTGTPATTLAVIGAVLTLLGIGLVARFRTGANPN